MRKYLLFAIVLITSTVIQAQDFSNKGKDFWVGYGYHQQMTNGGGGGSQDMVLYFATDQVTNIQITIPGTGYIQSITTPAGNSVTTSATIPKAGVNDARLTVEGTSNKGIHVTSDKPMVAYAHVYNQSVSGATILFPTNTLGRDYYSVNYKNWSNSQNSNCWFYVVAADTGTTTVQITPTGNTTGGWIAGTTYQVTLTQGQIYNVMGSLISSPNNCNPVCTGVDLTGSLIKSINTGTGCKKIAVFSGSGRISITCNSNSSSSDNYMTQALPKTAWGKKYLTAPANGNQAFNIYRVCVPSPTTIVKINGVATLLPLQNNFYYEIPATNAPQRIESDSAIMVAQYFTSQGACGNGNPGDPEVIYLSPVEQNINTVLWNATPNYQITTHSFNVVLPNTGTAISSFKLDGAPVLGWTVHPQDANYSYLRKTVAAGFHIITSDSGFNAIAYGFGSAESYGYNAGTNIKDLYQQIAVQSQYGIETTPSVCTNSPFKFKVSLPYIPDSMYWNFHGAANMLPNNSNVMVSNVPVNSEDSTTIVNGKVIHWYSLPTYYNFSAIGVYPVTITTYVPNADCGSVQDIDFDLTVTDPPVADFSWSGSGCVAETFQFNETTPQLPKPTYHFWWDFNDPASGVNNNSNARNPTHLFTAPGVYNVRFSDITTPGCLSDTIVHQVTVNPLPDATISGTNTVCINTPQPVVTFTGTGGTAPYTFTYNINGGTPLTVNSTTTIATVNVPTNTAGVFTYTLMNVKDTGSLLCTQNISGQQAVITVLPDHAIALTSPGPTANQTVCINSLIAPIIYTLSGGATGATVSGLPAGVTFTVTGNTLTITGSPNTTAGSPFNYTINTTGNVCLPASANGTITVSPDHTITLTSGAGSTNQTVCINAPITPITYDLGGGATGATVTGLPAGVSSSVAGTTLTISGAPTTTAGSPFSYSITTTGNACLTASANGTITVNPNPDVNQPANQTLCNNTLTAAVTFGGTVTGTVYNWTNSNTSIGLVASGTGNIPAFTAINATPFPVTATITVTPEYANNGVTCTGTPKNFTITVNPDHMIALSSAPPTTNQTVCINTPITPITYTLSGGATGVTLTGLPAGINFSVTGTTLTISGSPSTTTGSPFNYSITTTGNACATASANGTITVLPDHTISLSSLPPTANQSVCINTLITPIVYTLGGGAAGVTITGLPAGVNFVVAGNTVTISGSPSTTVGSPFNFTITTTGNACLTASATGSITVNPDHTILLTSAPATTNQTVCINLAITDITYTIGGGATGYTVTGLPAGVTGTLVGTTLTIHGSPSVSAGSPYNYTITTTGNGCVVATANGTITVNPLPTANFNFTAPSCETRVISFTDLSIPNAGTLNTWAWDFGDPASGPLNTSSLPNPVHVFANAGSYTVTLVVTSTTSCISSSFPRTVVINARPQAGYIIPEVCLSDTYAQFLDTSHISAGTITAWHWDFGDPVSGVNNTSILQNPQHSYTSVGSYNVELIVTSNFGCRDTIMQVLTVNGSYPDAIFSVNNAASLCANDSVAIVNNSTVFPGVITKVEIYWDDVNFPAVFELDNNPYPGKVYKHLYPNFQAPLTRPFTIRFRAYSGGVCSDDSLKTITVNAAPLVQFNAMPDTCLLAAPFQITQATEIGGVPGTFVYTGPGVSPTGIFSPAVAGVGTHTILYTFTSTAAGCIDTMSRSITVLDTAHATFSWVTPLCDGVPGSFTDHTTAPAGVTLSNTVWNFGDGSPVENHAPGSTFTHLFPAPNTYTVTMYAVSAYGCNSTVYTQFVTVDPNHTLSLSSGPGTDNQVVCINTLLTPIVYTLGGGATGATVTGLPAGVTSVVTGNTLTISGAPSTTAGTPFNYSITTTGNSCTTASATGTISVSANHTLTLTSAGATTDQRVCLNTTISDITYTLGGGAAGAIVTGLPPGVSATVTGNTLTISGTPASTAGTPYNYNIVTTGNNCVTASGTGVIKVSPYPRVNFTFDKPAYCIPNATVVFNSSASSIEDGTENQFTYLWNFGDPTSINNTSVAQSPSHYYNTTGPFPVQLTITSGFGCVHDTLIDLKTIHPQPRAAFDISKPSICIGDEVTFTDQSSPGDAVINKWFWDFGDGQTDSRNPVPHLYLSTDTFTVKLYVSDLFGCNSDTLPKPFAVYAYPTVDMGPDRELLEGGVITLNPVVTGDDLQYLWTPNLYLDDNRVKNATVRNPQDDITYKLTVTARGGCPLSKTVFVKLLRAPKIPNTFTPNNDGINDTWKIDYLNTYPNNRVQVFTRTGQLVFESHGYNVPWDGRYKGKPLPFDTYYYIIEPNNGRDPITGYVTIIR